MAALYSITTRATGTILTASIYNSDHQNHIDNCVPSLLDDYSANAAEMQTVADPGEVGAESLATSTAGELARLRFAIKELKQFVSDASALPAQWYVTPTVRNPNLAAMPVGSLTVWPSTGAAPSGYLLCNGIAVSRTTYAALFAVIGTTYGAGDGSTTFNLPDSRARSPIGSGQGSGLTNRVLAATVGAETHSLVSGELASHSHTVTDPGHNHGAISAITAGTHTHKITGYTVGGASNANGVLGSRQSYTTAPTSSSIANPHTHTMSNTGSQFLSITSASVGSGDAHENMGPFLVTRLMIKV